jgi:aryl-alcohol dehydrogenase-like predicted oxidoreductase
MENSNRLALGCMSMSGSYGQRDDAESIATIHEAIDNGINFIDTADFYGAGHNEELVGKAIKDRRDEIFLSVKIGPQLVPGGGFSTVNGHPDYIKNALAYSLRRLNTDYIDLYFPSRIDTRVPIEDQVGALQEMKEKGFIKHIGLSEASAATVRKAHAVHPITAVQIEYSLWSREPETELLPTLRELGIDMVGYSPLSRGFLSGEIKTPEDFAQGDIRKFMPRFQGDNFYKNLELVEKLKVFANQRNCTPTQLALAWVLAQGDDIICLMGTKKRKYLHENIEALKIKLTPEELASLNTIIDAGQVSGDRYNANGMKMVGN